MVVWIYGVSPNLVAVITRSGHGRQATQTFPGTEPFRLAFHANIEPIIKREFSQPDCAAIQDKICAAVEADPQRFLTAYRLDTRSFHGRYVNSDLMKEMCPEYSASKEHRNRYNLPVHNAAAVLASVQFRLTIADDSVPGRVNALFLTGVPGAGKTTSVIANRNRFPPHARILYEGQLADSGHALTKIEAALSQGLNVEILAIHVRSEQSLTHTISRYEREGRGATIEALARIQGNLAAGLRQIQSNFGDAVRLTVADNRHIINQGEFVAGMASPCLSRKEIMIELNETLPEYSKSDTPPDLSPAEPMTKLSEEPILLYLELFIQNAFDRFKDQTTPFPEVW